MREYIVKLSDEDVESISNIPNYPLFIRPAGSVKTADGKVTHEEVIDGLSDSDEAIVAGIIRQVVDQWSAQRDKIIAAHRDKIIVEYNALMKEAYESGNLETPAPDE